MVCGGFVVGTGDVRFTENLLILKFIDELANYYLMTS